MHDFFRAYLLASEPTLPQSLPYCMIMRLKANTRHATRDKHCLQSAHKASTLNLQSCVTSGCHSTGTIHTTHTCRNTNPKSSVV